MPTRRVNTTAPQDYADQDIESLAHSIRNILGADGFGRFADHVLGLAADDAEIPELVLMADGSQE